MVSAMQLGQAGVALLQPAARRDAVGLVVDAVRDTAGARSLKTVSFMSSVCSADDAVDRVRADEGEVAHAHPPLAALVDQARSLRISASVIPCSSRADFSRRGVDLVDDLHVPRQQPLEQRHRPALQRLGQQRVVGVGDGAAGELPGLVEVELVDVDEQPHQLGDARPPDGCR